MVVVVAMELVLVAFVIIVVRRALVLSIVQLEKISRVRKKKKKKNIPNNLWLEILWQMRLPAEVTISDVVILEYKRH